MYDTKLVYQNFEPACYFSRRRKREGVTFHTWWTSTKSKINKAQRIISVKTWVCMKTLCIYGLLYRLFTVDCTTIKKKENDYKHCFTFWSLNSALALLWHWMLYPDRNESKTLFFYLNKMKRWSLMIQSLMNILDVSKPSRPTLVSCRQKRLLPKNLDQAWTVDIWQISPKWEWIKNTVLQWTLRSSV